jgi:hypothetical protein
MYQRLGEIPMRASIAAITLTVAVVYSGYACAADAMPQPLRRADCEKAGMKWDENANVCGSAVATTTEKKEVKKAKTGHSKTTPTYHKKTNHPQHYTPTKREKRGFFKWLLRNDKGT